MSPWSNPPANALPLVEAVREFAPRKLWLAYQRALKSFDPSLFLQITWADASSRLNKGVPDPRADQVRSERAQVRLAWDRIEQALVAQLANGSLNLYAQHNPPFGRWRVLDPAICRDLQIKNLKTGRVKGPNFELMGVLVARSQPAESVELIPTKSGAAGRPTSMHLIETEFARRIRFGKIESSVKEQAEVLFKWLTGNHPKAPKCTAKTIENRIRAPYQRAKQAALGKNPKL